MEQIYYTQCPVGYGLGASNGFQVKRLSAGYTLTGDFAHFALRPFLPSSRTLAPAVLRYRKGTDGTAELASLSPRNQEYETERGLWGRPGGHFAHGLRLDPSEMERLGQWPAGLHGQPFWRKSDPEPSLGRPPEPFTISPEVLRIDPTFECAAALATGWDADLLARVLTVLAIAALEARTLVILDRPGRLADDVAILTLAFPDAWRADLTFSTYHDRPEELHGFRLQGTGPDPRLNRSAQVANGFLADLTKGVFEPEISPRRWAVTLANWLLHGDSNDRAAWEATNQRAALATAPGSVWSEEWLDFVYDLPAVLASTAEAVDWFRLIAMAESSKTSGLAAEWAWARPAAWWKERVEPGAIPARALLTHLELAEAWEPGATAWGDAVATWLEVAQVDVRRGLFEQVLEACPGAEKASFMRSLLASSSTERSIEIVRWVRGQGVGDPSLTLPIEVRGAVDRLAEQGDKSALRELLSRAVKTSAGLPEVLSAIGSEAAKRPKLAPILHKLVAVRIEEGAEVPIFRWALEQEGSEKWLSPYLRLISARPDALSVWKSLASRLGRAALPAFSRAALAVTGEPEVKDEVFRWCVESLLLTIPEADRPHDREWPGIYLDKTPSGLDLMRRLFGREYREIGLRRWLEDARDRGELSDDQLGRIEGAIQYARALKSGDVRALLNVNLPVVPASDRGTILAQILSHVGTKSEGALGTALDTCRAAWPDGFDPGVEGLHELAEPLAERLASECVHPEIWLRQLVHVIDRLGVNRSPLRGFEPNGLAAHIIAATTRKRLEGFSPWKLRQFLLENETTWRALAEDVRQDLGDVASFEHWDSQLSKGMHTSRFFELWLNCAEGTLLSTIVSRRAVDLRTIPDLSWWNHSRFPDTRDDLRDAFARLSPIAPLPENELPALQAWLRRPAQDAISEASPRSIHGEDLVPLAGETRPTHSKRGSSLSALGLARWRCIEALTTFYRAGFEGDGCWQIVAGWTTTLPLDQLVPDDQLLFLSWLIPRLEEPDSVKIGRLASWLVRMGMSDPDQVSEWAERLEPFQLVSDATKLVRVALVADLRAEWRTVLRERSS